MSNNKFKALDKKIKETEYELKYLYGLKNISNYNKENFYNFKTWLEKKGFIEDDYYSHWYHNGNRIEWKDIVINNWEEFVNEQK